MNFSITNIYYQMEKKSVKNYVGILDKKIIVQHCYFVAFTQQNKKYRPHSKNHRTNIVKTIVPRQ